MPPEWAPHDATWMAFPRDSYEESGLTREAVQRAWASVANAVSEYEPVSMLCHPDDEALARQYLSSAVALHPMPLNDAWLRDNGPTFVTENDALIAVDWRFNGWGHNTEFDWQLDDAVAAQVADLVGASVDRAKFVNEGGGIHVDGQGTVLLTETVQLDPQRNGQHSRAEMTEEIHRFLGTDHAIWLPRGLYRDYLLNGTRGHIDMIACFTPAGSLLVHQQIDSSHPDFALWSELKTALEPEGLTILPLPAPSTLKDHRDWVDYSYVNHYVCNDAVICPTFDDAQDDHALGILSEVYPSRRIVGVEAREIFAMGGGIHCITQQQPSLPGQ